MIKLIHIIAIWLIAIILPMQGFAAATQLHCEKAQPHQHDSETVHAHTHAMAVTEHHAHTHRDASAHACNHCAKCSACCSGFVFNALSDASMPHLNLANVVIGFTAPAFSSHIPSGPERPPRLTLV